MIRRVSGEITELSDEMAVLRTRTGICYEVLVGAYALPELRALMAAGEPVELHTYHYLEGNVAAGQFIPRLTGFLSEGEREFFLRFIKIPGLSPRSTIRAFALPPERIAGAIAAGQPAILTKLPGIGKKKADQIISSLQEKIGELTIGAAAAPASAADAGLAAQRAEAMGVLVSQLGYRTPEAEDLIERAVSAIGGEADTEAILETVFRLSR